MLGWSINLFRVFGIQLAVHASFLLLLVYAGFEGWNDGGWEGMLSSVLLITLFFVCVILHELGHSLTARTYGVKVPRILLLPIGGMAEFDRIPRQPVAEFFITIAGPLVNFAIVAVLWIIVGLPEGTLTNPQFPDTLRGLGQLLLYWNGAMGCFNLLPVFPMDGGRIFRALLATKLPYLKATHLAVRIGQILAITIICLAAFSWHRPMLVLLFAFIIFAGDAEYKQLLRREREAQYWADMARRIVESVPATGPVPPPPQPPPIALHGPN